MPCRRVRALACMAFLSECNQHSKLVKFWPEECGDLVGVLYYHFTCEPVLVPFTHDSLLRGVQWIGPTVAFQFLTSETHKIKCWDTCLPQVPAVLHRTASECRSESPVWTIFFQCARSPLFPPAFHRAHDKWPDKVSVRYTLLNWVSPICSNVVDSCANGICNVRSNVGFG